MKVACLQFAPELGKVKENIERADRLLEASAAELRTPQDGRSLWLVLPEMAFSGYNFQSLEEITPYLEASCTGVSTQWASATARKYGIYVTVGYPETVPPPQQQRQGETPSTVEQTPSQLQPQPNYNSTVTVSPTGAIIATYRKHFLYYTDETWALPGPGLSSTTATATTTAPGHGFFAGDLGSPLGRVSHGICMDINPHRFLAPWTTYEFATHCVREQTPLVVLSMAWLTRLAPEELTQDPSAPDDETFVYWIERFSPLREREGRPTVVVCTNRCGSEGGASYAGTSSVFLFDGRGRVEIFDVCGKGEERVMVVDLAARPKFALQRGRGGGGVGDAGS